MVASDPAFWSSDTGRIFLPNDDGLGIERCIKSVTGFCQAHKKTLGILLENMVFAWPFINLFGEIEVAFGSPEVNQMLRKILWKKDVMRLAVPCASSIHLNSNLSSGTHELSAS